MPSTAAWMLVPIKVNQYFFMNNFSLSHFQLSPFPRTAAYVLNMTSQRWLTDSEFSEGSQSGSIWWHYLVVIVPENVKYTRNGTLWITGYSMSTIPDEHNEDVIYTAALATNVGIVTGILFQVCPLLNV
jgi:hypothetical protein